MDTIEHLPIDAIAPYKHNPKTHPQEQVEKIAASRQAYGFLSPLLIDAHNTIIAGHGRLLAAKHLGLASVPVIRAAALTPDQVRAYRLADNKLAELSEWDWQSLAKDFTLEEMEALIPTTGITQDDLSRFVEASHHALTPDEALQAADQAASESDAVSDFEREMNAPVQPKMAIVPQYCEDYEAFIIVCTNTIDEAYMRQALALNDLAVAYSDSKIKRPNILTVEQFKKLWESRS